MSGSVSFAANNQTISLQSGVSYIIYGSNDVIWGNANDSITLVGDDDTVTGGGGSVVTLDGNNDVTGVPAGDSVIVNGQNAAVYGSGVSVGLDTAGASATVYGYQDNVTGYGAQDTITISGTADTATFLGGGTFNAGSSSTSATLNGDQVTAWLNGTTGVITVNGNMDTLTGGTDANVVLNGNSDVVGTGAGSTVTVNSGYGIVYGTQTTIEADNQNGTTVVFGSDNATFLNSAGQTVDDDGTTDSVIGLNSGETLNLGTPQGVSANVSVGVSGSGGTVNNDNASDSVALFPNTSVTVNGSGGAIGLANNNDSVATNNETIYTAQNIANATVTGSGDTLLEWNNVQANIQGDNDFVALQGNNDSIGLLGGSNDTVEMDASDESATVINPGGYTVNDDYASDFVTLLANTSATVNGSGGGVLLDGSNDSVATNNETVYTGQNIANLSVTGTGDTLDEWSNVGADVTGSNDFVAMQGNGDSVGFLGGSNDTVDMQGANEYAALLNGTSYTVYGDMAGDTVNLTADTYATVNGSGGAIGLLGSGATVTASDETVTTLGGVQYATVVGNDDMNYLVGGNTIFTALGNDDTVDSVAGNIMGFSGIADTAQINNGIVYLDTAGTTVTVEGNSDTISTASSDTVVGLTGFNDVAQVSNGLLITNASSLPSLTVQGSGDSEFSVAGATQSYPVMDDATASDVDAIYNAVLDRDADSTDYVAAEVVLAGGGGMAGVMSMVANLGESQADMASTYAAIGADPPSQAEFGAFADAMSTSYGEPIELFSVDPVSGAQTVLADTSTTNLLAELPVLETEANGVNLALQLADGMQIGFDTTGRLAQFLYAVSVQQLQATSFVTDNYNLDEQWLNTVDQPLLNEAVSWSEQATAEVAQGVATAAADNAGGWTTEVEAPFNQIAAEDKTMASEALKIAAEAPGNRQDMTVTIANIPNDSTTQVTVYAGGGDRIHDVSGGVWQDIEGVVSTVLDIVALASANPYLYFAAAAIDGAEAGQAFSNGQDLSGILSLAQAVSSGITAEVGVPASAASASTAQITAEVLNVAAEGVGGVYGVVQSAENGNALGILAGVLEAAAAGATGIELDSSPANQVTLNQIAAGLALGAAGTSFASDFNNGDLGEGLVDSLNLFLGAANAAYAVDSANQSNLVMNDQAFAAAEANAGAYLTGSNSFPASSAPLSNGVGLRVTVLGATNTIYVAPASSGSSGQAIGSAPLVVQIVPDAAAAPGGNDGTVSPQELSAAISQIGEGPSFISADSGIGGDGVPRDKLLTSNGNLVYSDEVHGPFSDSLLQMTSGYGVPRQGGTVHSGVDLQPITTDNQINTDATALSVTIGVVVRIGATGFGPDAVIVQTPEGNWAVYGHLASESVNVGDFVLPGTPIGIIGNQGLVSPQGVGGTHLHFEIMTGALFGPNARYLGIPGY